MERKTNTLPVEMIKELLADSDCDVRAAAVNACRTNGIPIPFVRTFEPPERVYKKCRGGVIVVAHITDDAQVRGKMNGKCRADKAEIIEIIGGKVGISKHDSTICYLPGDTVVIENFDFSNEECGKGFHFFCTKEEAERYR